MSEHSHTSHHIASAGSYIGIFLALMFLTALTVWVATHDWGVLNTPIAMAIAVVKATLVILYFMHLKYSPSQTKLVMVTGIFGLIIMLVITFFDYMSRGWQSLPTGWTEYIR